MIIIMIIIIIIIIFQSTNWCRFTRPIFLLNFLLKRYRNR